MALAKSSSARADSCLGSAERVLESATTDMNATDFLNRHVWR
jgi:hypothetical protein